MRRTFDYYAGADAAAPDHDSWWRYGPDGKLGDAGAAVGGTINASHARDLRLAAAGGTLTAAQATALQGLCHGQRRRLLAVLPCRLRRLGT